jgi:hypothetical protein
MAEPNWLTPAEYALTDAACARAAEAWIDGDEELAERWFNCAAQLTVGRCYLIGSGDHGSA